MVDYSRDTAAAGDNSQNNMHLRAIVYVSVIDRYLHHLLLKHYLLFMMVYDSECLHNTRLKLKFDSPANNPCEKQIDTTQRLQPQQQWLV